FLSIWQSRRADWFRRRTARQVGKGMAVPQGQVGRHSNEQAADAPADPGLPPLLRFLLERQVELIRGQAGGREVEHLRRCGKKVRITVIARPRGRAVRLP